MARARLVTIVAEALLERRLIDEILALGASGYTLSNVRGDGSRGVRASHWEGGNIKFEVIASPDVAAAILERLEKTYFASYAIIAWASDVEVIRGAKFVGGSG